MKKFLTSCIAIAALSLPAFADDAPATNIQAVSAPVLSPYTLNDEQISVLDTGEPVLEIWEGAKKRSIVEVFGAIDINATPAQIWKIMKNCDQQLQIVTNMTKCKIKKEGLPVPRRLMQKATREDMPKVLKNLRKLAEKTNQAPLDAPATSEDVSASDPHMP